MNNDMFGDCFQEMQTGRERRLDRIKQIQEKFPDLVDENFSDGFYIDLAYMDDRSRRNLE